MSNDFIDVTEYSRDSNDRAFGPVVSSKIRRSNIIGIKLHKYDDQERTEIYIYTSHGTYNKDTYTLDGF